MGTKEAATVKNPHRSKDLMCLHGKDLKVHPGINESTEGWSASEIGEAAIKQWRGAAWPKRNWNHAQTSETEQKGTQKHQQLH